MKWFEEKYGKGQGTDMAKTLWDECAREVVIPKEESEGEEARVL